MFGLKSICLCVVKIITRKKPLLEGEDQQPNQQPNQSIKNNGNQGITNNGNQKQDLEELELPITELVRQFAECNYK